MSQSKRNTRAVRRGAKRTNHQDVVRRSSMLTFLRVFMSRSRDDYTREFCPALKDYNNMIIDKATNEESSLDCVIFPGCESNLPTNIHPKEIRLVTLSGYDSNTKPDDVEFEEWYSSFDGYAICSWVVDVVARNKRQKRYRTNNSQMYEYQTNYHYDRFGGLDSYCCHGCWERVVGILPKVKNRRKTNLVIRIDNDIKSMYCDKDLGRDEYKVKTSFR